MIFCIVISHARKRLFWLKLTGKFELESLLKATSSVLKIKIKMTIIWYVLETPQNENHIHKIYIITPAGYIGTNFIFIPQRK
jgi:hypothetical protein